MFDLLSRELLRKTFHITGSLIPIIYYFISRETALIVLSSVNAFILLIEWLRLRGKIKLPDILLRPHENKQVAAYIYFNMAALISILIFDKTVAIAALLMLSIGDAASGLAGSMIKGGDIRNRNRNRNYNRNQATKNMEFKPLPIMALMFAVCILIGLVLLNLPLAEDMTHLSFLVYAAGAAGATLGDAVPVQILGRQIDDNLMIPLLSGLFMTAAAFF
ncbi:dolichol kinase [Candidatus Methanoperedens nitroreducens]|uniref:Dolichol kinase n=1 Tax=Candidatus Methanoperedens nitratireducens TaxID=1392998 RepID=A0A062V1Z1_9EURY|nr:hypothetical protein [Candidatus Methanoperedens nitroreducens]KCZ73121.1 dolichol kinase [Candidatus Methanoperedens nitroreducens]MDJ1422932.1 hypothetical protein [Candidatus Methanoperedens sp.]